MFRWPQLPHEDSWQERIIEFGDTIFIYDMDYTMSQEISLPDYVLRNYRKFIIVPSSPHSYSLSGLEDFIARAIRLDAEIGIHVLNIFIDSDLMSKFSELIERVISIPPTIDVRIIDEFDLPVTIQCDSRSVARLNVYTKKGNLAVIETTFYEFPRQDEFPSYYGVKPSTMVISTPNLANIYPQLFIYSGLTPEFHDEIKDLTKESFQSLKPASVSIFDYTDRDVMIRHF
jgi:hypothetical protein